MIITNPNKLIGNTPLYKLKKLIPAYLPDFLIKLEYFNPGGSVKDRPAENMILTAENNGDLPKGGGGLIIEATSGNTGVGLARATAVRGHECLLVLPESASEEKRKLMQAFGAKLELTPVAKGMRGAYQRSQALAEENPKCFRPDQFTNPANPESHRQSTGKEIITATRGNFQALVASTGTGGTITGTGEYLRKIKPDIDIFTFESENSPFLSQGKSGCHNIPGTGPGFVPDILNQDIYDEIILVNEAEVYDVKKQLALQEGLLLGPSSAAGIVTALQIANRYKEKDRIVIIAPDGGERYFSETISQ